MNTSLLFSSFPFIAGRNVTLSRMTEVDAEALWAVLGDEENFRYAPTAPLPSPALCAQRIARYDAMFRDRVAIVLGIYPGGGSGPLGGIFEMYNFDTEIQSVTVRFTLSKEFTGQSFATGALRAVIEYLMDSVGVHRIQAYVQPANYRGVLVLERCGFKKEGTIREGFLWPDKGIVDLSLYSLLPTDVRRHPNSHVF